MFHLPNGTLMIAAALADVRIRKQRIRKHEASGAASSAAHNRAWLILQLTVSPAFKCILWPTTIQASVLLSSLCICLAGLRKTTPRHTVSAELYDYAA